MSVKAFGIIAVLVFVAAGAGFWAALSFGAKPEADLPESIGRLKSEAAQAWTEAKASRQAAHDQLNIWAEGKMAFADQKNFLIRDVEQSLNQIQQGQTLISGDTVYVFTPQVLVDLSRHLADLKNHTLPVAPLEEAQDLQQKAHIQGQTALNQALQYQEATWHHAKQDQEKRTVWALWMGWAGLAVCFLTVFGLACYVYNTYNRAAGGVRADLEKGKTVGHAVQVQTFGPWGQLAADLLERLHQAEKQFENLNAMHQALKREHAAAPMTEKPKAAPPETAPQSQAPVPFVGSELLEVAGPAPDLSEAPAPDEVPVDNDYLFTALAKDTQLKKSA